MILLLTNTAYADLPPEPIMPDPVPYECDQAFMLLAGEPFPIEHLNCNAIALPNSWAAHLVNVDISYQELRQQYIQDVTLTKPTPWLMRPSQQRAIGFLAGTLFVGGTVYLYSEVTDGHTGR